MDPFLEQNPIFHELHTQMLAEFQARLQPQLRPKYVARLERHLSEGSQWELGVESLDRKEPDILVATRGADASSSGPAMAFSQPTATEVEDLDPDELELRKQRRIVIYVNSKPRQAVTGIELLSPSNKQRSGIGQARYLEKRASALHGGLHWVEIDLIRGGQRPSIPVRCPKSGYLAYVARATATGWIHHVFAWNLKDLLPILPIPLLNDDRAVLELGPCFQQAYDRIAADDEVDYNAAPPHPELSPHDAVWVDELLRKAGMRR
jgi:hypothetical protein